MAEGYGMAVMPETTEELFVQAYAELIYAFEPNAELLGTYRHLMQVFSPDSLVELEDYITIPTEVEAGEKTGEGPMLPEQRERAQQSGETDATAAQRAEQANATGAGGHGAKEEPTSLGTMAEVSPVILALAEQSWGVDLADVEVVEDASLVTQGRRGAVSDGQTIRLAPGGSNDIHVLLEELAHIVQHRNASSGTTSEHAPRDEGALEAEAQQAVENAICVRPFEIVGMASRELHDDGVATQPPETSSKSEAKTTPNVQLEAMLTEAVQELAARRDHALAQADPIAHPAVEAQYAASRQKLDALRTNVTERANAIRTGRRQAGEQADIHDREGAHAHADEERRSQCGDDEHLDTLAWQARAALAEIEFDIVPLIERDRYDEVLVEKQRDLVAQADAFRVEIEERTRRELARSPDKAEVIEQARQTALERVADVENQLREDLDAQEFARRELLTARVAEVAETVGTAEASERRAALDHLTADAELHLDRLSAASTRVDLLYSQLAIERSDTATQRSVEEEHDALGLVSRYVLVEPTGEGQQAETQVLPDRHTARFLEHVARREAFADFARETLVEGIKSQDPTSLENLAMAGLPFALGPILSGLKASKRLTSLLERTNSGELTDLRRVARQNGMADNDADELIDLMGEARRLPQGQHLQGDKAERLGSLLRHLDAEIRSSGKLRSAGQNRWSSTRGLNYGNDARHGNRVKHVLRHAEDNPARPMHGVFDGGSKQALKTVDEAWQHVQSGGGGVIVTQQRNRTVYTVDMGHRVGYVGGSRGAASGYPEAAHVRIVVENGNEVITAFPIIP